MPTPPLPRFLFEQTYADHASSEIDAAAEVLRDDATDDTEYLSRVVQDRVAESMEVAAGALKVPGVLLHLAKINVAFCLVRDYLAGIAPTGTLNSEQDVIDFAKHQVKIGFLSPDPEWQAALNLLASL